jgi:hypothetical protein
VLGVELEVPPQRLLRVATPEPSVPSGVKERGTQRATMSGTAFR